MKLARPMPTALVAALASVSAFSAFSVLSPCLAWADTKAADCIDANSTAQDARAAGHFEKTREALSACMVPACPKRIRDDCTERWEELQRAQPTVVLSAKDGAGADLDAVSVTIDGRPLASKLDGGSQRVDPGAHEFVFTQQGTAPITVRAVIKEGEHARSIAAVIVTASPPSIPAAKPPPAAAPDGRPAAAAASSSRDGTNATSGGGTWRTVGLVGGAAGIVAIGVGVVFGGLALGSKGTENSHCGSAIGAPSSGDCDAQGVAASSSLSSQANLSTAFIVGGAVLGAAGVVLYLAAPQTPHLQVGLGSLSLAGTF